MQLVVDQFETLAAVVLQPIAGPLTDEQFLELCARYPDCRIETSAEGDILIISPAHPRTGNRNAALTAKIFLWAEQDGRGESFDSSTGFFLPNGARRSPDAAWISKERLAACTSDAALWHATPQFVIELASTFDRVSPLRSKMREWMDNGVELGWLILPETRTVEIYRSGGAVETLHSPAVLQGEGPVAGFHLEMDRIWQAIPK